MEVKIEKNVPFVRTGAGAPNKYPWREMEVGDSFVLPYVRRGFSTMAKLAGIKVATRKEGDKLRVWRIA